MAKPGFAQPGNATKLQLPTFIRSAPDYLQRVLATRPGDIIGYWPLDDAPGSAVARDASPNGFHGVATNVQFGATGINDGGTSAQFSGTGYINVFSTGLASKFILSRAKTIMLWVSTSYWKTNIMYFLSLVCNSNNYISVRRPTFGHYMTMYGTANSSGGANYIEGFDVSQFVCLADVVDIETRSHKSFVNGKQIGSAGVGAAFAVPLTVAMIGALNTTPQYPVYGKMAHIAAWNGALTSGEIGDLANAGNPPF